MPDEWQPHSEGFPAMLKIQSGEYAKFNNLDSQVVVKCRLTQKTHPAGIFYGENPLQYSFPLLLLEIVMVILIIRAIRFLLKPLKQPRVVSEIIGGIIIGPSVLGRSKKFTAYMFPEDAAFLVKNIGTIGFMFFLFVTGVKMDLGIIRKSGRKQWLIALFGVLLPTLMVLPMSILLRKSLDKELGKTSSIGTISGGLAITAFPVLHPILKELNLLSSEVGQLALTTAIITDIIGLNAVVAFEAAKQGEVHLYCAVSYMISLVVLATIVVTVVRQAMVWIVQKTPQGKPVEQIYIYAILLGVMVLGFLTDMFGVAIANGSFWLGLVIPDGPPLGAALVERTETIIMEILMPFSFAYVGLYTDVFSISVEWSCLGPLCAIIMVGYVGKFVATLLASLYFEMPFRDSLTLGLMMSLRGQVELLLFIHWIDKKILKTPSFTVLVVLTTMVTAIATPLISILYDPTTPYMVNKRRTIQHTPVNNELHIVACIHDEESVAGIIDLLEVSINPTLSSPCVVYALRLVELVGRASPVFINHEKQMDYLEHTSSNTIHNALKMYEEIREDLVKIHLFTAVSPQESMHQDICKLAHANKATLIILPFNQECLDSHGGTELVRLSKQYVNYSNVLSHAPCSVGILVEKDPLQNHPVMRSFQHSAHHFVVLFLGGADAREALAYADRMAQNPDVYLTVIRFLSYNNEGDDVMEKKLDDGLVTWFWVKNESNNQVVYREVVVRDGEETVAAIRDMNDDYYDLWIVGRKHGINPVLLEGLSDWSENHELGIIGDYVASMDFPGMASVLVVQQQVLRGQGMATCRAQERFTCRIC